MILVFVERGPEVIDALSAQALTLGRRVAEAVGEPLGAVAVGGDHASLASALGGFGVERVHLVLDDRLEPYAPHGWARGVSDAIDASGPSIVLASGGERSTEVLARVAAIRGLPMAANCIDVRPGEPFLVTRHRWAGSLLEEAAIDAPVKLLTVAPHAVAAEPVGDAATASVEVVEPTLKDEDLRVRVTGITRKLREGVALTDAKVVVGGGRGVGGAEGFGQLEELARLLGGTVGVSRVVTSAGWRPHSDQIGQTGARIAPELYIACGISGAIQHMVGARGAKRILVINTDPDAPIVAKADYAVIGDLHQVVPALISAIREATG